MNKNEIEICEFEMHLKNSCFCLRPNLILNDDIISALPRLACSRPRDSCIGVRAGGARGAAAPPKFGQLRFFGQHEKIWAKTSPCFSYYFEEINIFYFNLKSA